VIGYGEAVIVDDVTAVAMANSRPPIYDRDVELRLLYRDPHTGAEHYVVRYPAGLQASRHRHSVAHTVVVLEGRLRVNDQVIGPGGYCHFPAHQVMSHAPADGEGCTFVTIFHGPFDVEIVDR
jgi:quercetin dioxygenase-like cupin family protein